MKPKEHSKAEPHCSWTEQEKWVWSRISEGEVADFNSAEDYGGKFDPKKPEEWPESRILTPAFLETILLNEPYRGSLTRHGVQISGALFKKPVELSNATLNHQLCLEDSHFNADADLSYLKATNVISLTGSKFTGKLYMQSMEVKSHLLMKGGNEFVEVDLGNAKIGGVIDMSGSKFTGKLIMNAMEVESHLLMSDGAEFGEVDLGNTKIGGGADMSGSKFTGKLNMNAMEVKSHLFLKEGNEFVEVDLGNAKIGGGIDMSGSKFTGELHMQSMEVERHLLLGDGAEFGEVDLGDTKIGGVIDMSGSKFTGKLNMNAMEVKSHLFLKEGTEFGEVDLGNAKIGGGIDMSGSKFTGKLNMSRLKVESSLYMRSNAEFTEVDLGSSKIGGMVDISDSTFQCLDMTGTQIKEELCLGYEGLHPKGLENGSELILRNTEVGVLLDAPNAWPDKLEIVGFTYSRLGGLASGKSHSMIKKDIIGRKEWLNKQKSYSPQPYVQLGKILREAGYKNMANDILFESKKRERRETSSWLNWLNLTLQYFFVGFGYRISFTFFWAIALTLIGAFVLKSTGQGLSNNMPYGFSYSLDMLLPVIKLNESHYDIILKGIAKYYFYIHIILGYVLASFLIAGLSGITKK
jgi:uncharacterized protein YjbI with pentapeptide repeats